MGLPCNPSAYSKTPANEPELQTKQLESNRGKRKSCHSVKKKTFTTAISPAEHAGRVVVPFGGGAAVGTGGGGWKRHGVTGRGLSTARQEARARSFHTLTAHKQPLRNPFPKDPGRGEPSAYSPSSPMQLEVPTGPVILTWLSVQEEGSPCVIFWILPSPDEVKEYSEVK